LNFEFGFDFPMHELSLMEATLAIALEQAHQHHADHIHRLVLRIGALSGVVPDALEFAFDVVTQGTMAEGASLDIESVPTTCYCNDCQTSFQPNDYIFECPTCGGISSQILSGKEIELSSLELS
jgi:hydrogenase nickel incorporation protein HypA/HybF